MSLYKRRFRVEPARLRSWDYGGAGWYFVTICVSNKRHLFGTVHGDRIDLSEAGMIAAEQWMRSEEIRSEIQLDEWIIMPNHLHGIVVIDTPGERIAGGSPGVNTFGPQRRNLGSMIGGFKGAVASRLRTSLDPQFAWQERYHDRILRSEHQLDCARRYIIENPTRWSARLYR